MANEAVKYVWEGAIPLQIHLHKSEVASHPAPPPALVLAPRIGYLPLLVALIKPYFQESLPPGEDSIWFDYKGFPLKWYIPTGVLFDLLCAEPERPWNLTIHFRGYPSNILIPCEGEDSVKWNFVNSLKEAAYIINGSCKNVMNMSQSDQEDLWTSVMNGDLDAYTRLSPKLKMGSIEDEFSGKTSSSSPQSRQGGSETDVAGQVKTARIPVRLYVRSINQDFENLEDVPEIDTWDDISYLNRPVEFLREEGKCFTLRDAIETLLPEFIGKRAQTIGEEGEERAKDESEEAECSPETSEIKLVRIQGIETKLEIPFSWVVNNLMNPEFYLHISVLVKAPQR
uniref:Autophagy protein 5 n=1 Tax=Noccaea caerulescens TaxID=107243 RepID=A0A1J3JYF0_NOCCA